MKFAIYTIYDVKTDVHAAPFTSHNNNTAMRSFGDIATDPQTQLYKHPADFQLIRVGTWDDDTAELAPENLQQIASAMDFRNDHPETTE